MDDCSTRSPCNQAAEGGRRSSWLSCSAAGEDRIHAVTVAKGDLLGFANRVRYQETTGGHWSRGLELGLAGDRPDLVRLGAGEQRDAFVVMPGPTGGLIGRWITRDRQAQQRRE